MRLQSLRHFMAEYSFFKYNSVSMDYVIILLIIIILISTRGVKTYQRSWMLACWRSLSRADQRLKGDKHNSLMIKERMVFFFREFWHSVLIMGALLKQQTNATRVIKSSLLSNDTTVWWSYRLSLKWGQNWQRKPPSFQGLIVEWATKQVETQTLSEARHMDRTSVDDQGCDWQW
jgi:hypothetical protein